MGQLFVMEKKLTKVRCTLSAGVNNNVIVIQHKQTEENITFLMKTIFQINPK